MEETQKLLGLDYSVTSPEVIEVLIEDISETGIFEEIAKANMHRPEILKMLFDHSDTPSDVRQFISEKMSVPVVTSSELSRVEKAEKTAEARRETMTMKIQKLNVSARVQLALKGGREIRGILARDTNKEVMLSVLDNGKITESEIEMIARSRSSIEDALRKISRNREWMKSYSVVLALVNNPKTPAGIAVTHVSDLKTKDLSMLEKNKNVAEAVRSASKRLLMVRKPR